MARSLNCFSVCKIPWQLTYVYPYVDTLVVDILTTTIRLLLFVNPAEMKQAKSWRKEWLALRPLPPPHPTPRRCSATRAHWRSGVATDSPSAPSARKKVFAVCTERQVTRKYAACGEWKPAVRFVLRTYESLLASIAHALTATAAHASLPPMKVDPFERAAT